MSKHNQRLSKALSWVLRHHAVNLGLNINDEGYVLLDDLLKLDKFNTYTFNDIDEVVKNNDKKRFSLKLDNDKWYIRANQGHSIKVGSKINQKLLLKKLNNPLPLAVHGTTKNAFEIIKKSGLKKMNRTHIHFACNDNLVEGNTNQSGIRANCEILIYLDMKKAMSDGIEFFVSDNQVILSPGLGKEGFIDKKYFDKVIDKKTAAIINLN